MRQSAKGGMPARRNVKFLIILLLLLFVVFCPDEGMAGRESLPASTADKALNRNAILARAAASTIPFVKNDGQFSPEVTYAADLFAGRFFLTGKELVYSLFKNRKNNDKQPEINGPGFEGKKHNGPGKRLIFREFFVDQTRARIDFKSNGEQQAKTKVSYFKGKDPEKWRAGIASFQYVSLGEVFPGIEVKLKASGNNVEKIFHVRPGSRVEAIRIGVEGVAGLKIAKDGRLLFKNGLGEIAMQAPVAWQEIAGRRRSVKVSYRLLGKRLYGFEVAGDYAKDRELVIDPDLDVLQASTFLGGSKYNYGYSLALDGAGNVYVTGSTHSPDFPTTDGAFDREFDEVDAFVSKLDGDLTTLLASTFLSGNEYDSGSCLVLDGDGNVCLAGATKSTDFPTTDGAYDRTFNGDNFYTNIFVSKLNGDLTQLLASTLMGGYIGQDVTSLALDGSGNVYLAGSTRSPDFPTTTGAYDRTCNAIWNKAFVSKLNGSLTQLLASTFLGGSMGDSCFALALDGSGSVYLTGGTGSEDFPTTAGAYDRVFKKVNWSDVYVAKLDGGLTTLVASTLLGGDGFEGGHSLGLDSAGNVYLTGVTGSPDFPTTPGAYDRTYNDQPVLSGLGGDAFVSILNKDLTALLASTFLGGSKADKGVSLALGASGDVYLGGATESADFPATAGCYDLTYNEGGDVFTARLNGGLSALLAATYLGGNGIDSGRAIVVDGAGKVYLAGYTHAADFPTTVDSFDPSYNGDYGNVFIALFRGGLGGSLYLSVERKEVRAFSIMRQYGWIQFLGGDPGTPVAQYRLLRRKGNEGFVLLKTIAPSELQNNQFQMQDKYLEKDVPYTYRLEGYDAAGQLIGISTEKTI